MNVLNHPHYYEETCNSLQERRFVSRHVTRGLPHPQVAVSTRSLGKLDDVYGRLSEWLSAGVGAWVKDEWLPRLHHGGCLVCCGKIGEPGNFFLLSTRCSYLRNSLVLGEGGGGGG